MTKEELCEMLDMRPTLPREHFTGNQIAKYEATIEAWHRTMLDHPPYKPGARVRCKCGFWGDPDSPTKGRTATVVGSAWWLGAGYGHGGDGANLTASECDAMNGHDNPFLNFYKYQIRFDDTHETESWWIESRLEPVLVPGKNYTDSVLEDVLASVRSYFGTMVDVLKTVRGLAGQISEKTGEGDVKSDADEIVDICDEILGKEEPDARG